jgi:hypothetical protein
VNIPSPIPSRLEFARWQKLAAVPLEQARQMIGMSGMVHPRDPLSPREFLGALANVRNSPSSRAAARSFSTSIRMFCGPKSP